MWKAYANAGETKLRLAEEHRERGRTVRRQSSQHADKMKNIAYFLGQINKGLSCRSYTYFLHVCHFDIFPVYFIQIICSEFIAKYTKINNKY